MSLHCFQNDRDGTFIALVAELKSLTTVTLLDLAFLCGQTAWKDLEGLSATVLLE